MVGLRPARAYQALFLLLISYMTEITLNKQLSVSLSDVAFTQRRLAARKHRQLCCVAPISSVQHSRASG